MTPEQKEILRVIIRNKQQEFADREEYSPTKGMSGFEKFRAGYGRAAAGVIGALLPKELEPDVIKAASDEELNRELLSTGAGMAGDIVGGMVTTAPVGMGVGAAVKGGAGALRTGSLLRKALAARPVVAAAQGASEGALLAPEGQRLKGAMTAGALGGGMSGLATGVGRLNRALANPIATSTDDAFFLQEAMRKATGRPEFQIPLSHAAKPGIVKQVYEGLVANIPKSGPVLRKQHEEALNVFRETAISKGLPKIGGKMVKLDDVYRHGDDIQAGFKNLNKVWQKAFAPVNKIKTKAPPQFNAFKKLRGLLEDNKAYLPKAGEDITGTQLTRLKTAINRLISKKLLNEAEGKKALGAVDDVIKKNLTTKQWADYQFNLNRYPVHQALRLAAHFEKATSKFSPAQLGKAAATKSGAKGIEGGTPNLTETMDLAKMGINTLEGFPSMQGIFQIGAALGMTSGYLTGGAGGAAVVPGIIAVSRGMASPGFQRRLAEGFVIPKAMDAASKNHAKLLRGLGFATRQAAIAAEEGT